MITKEKACSTAATVEQAAEVETAKQAVTFSKLNFSTSGPPCQTGLVSRNLHRGRANAIPGHQLVEQLGFTDGRTLTQAIERERRAGVPICASCGETPGYYLAESPDELEAYLRSLDRRLRSVGMTRKHLGDVHDRWTGQQRMEVDYGG